MSLWQELQTPPFNPDSNMYRGNMHQLNDTELLFIPDTMYERALWKYNLIKNEWIEWISIPSDCSWQYHTSSLDTNNMILYIFGERGYILKIDLKTEIFTVSENMYHDGSHCKSLFINGKFNIFFGWDDNNKNHYIWDDQQQHLQKVFEFGPILAGIRNTQSVMHSRLKNQVYIIQAMDSIIYTYSLGDKTCTKIELDFGECAIFDSAVLTKDERYIICFVGLLDGSGFNIKFIDLTVMRVFQSNISTPDEVLDTFCVTNDERKEELLTSGYVRNCWKMNEFKDMRYPPVYLVKVIEKYVCFEMLYYLGNRLWKINVDEILTER